MRPLALFGTVAVAVVLAGGVAPAALAKGVDARFELSDPAGGPFPSDRFTVPDATQLTGLRVNLPKPDCGLAPSDCEDIDVLNTLDGFNLQPRLSIPFTGPIDLSTVSGETVFLFKLGPDRSFVGINQVVWDPDTTTLHVESDQLLDQDARYLLVMTDGVRDASGDSVGSAQFRKILNFGQTQDPASKAYRADLLAALDLLEAAGVPTGRVAAASIFTTQSATAVLEKIRNQLHKATPSLADFLIGPDGTRAVFPLGDARSITFNREITTTPTFQSMSVPINLLKAVPGVVGTVAFGRYRSPDYETAAGVIPPVGTRTGLPAARGINDVYFNLVLPAGPRPTAGWPVAIVGHGGSAGNKNGPGPLQIAAALAQRGIAAITFNGVGHGGGPLGTLVVTKTDNSTVTLPAGGRGSDLDGDGLISADEGWVAAPPQALVGPRDGISQTVIDAMQLVRVIEAGVDVNGDSAPDLDPSRIYYWGSSFSGILGTDFMALEPRARAGVLAYAGGAQVEAWRLGFFRPRVGQFLFERMPSLLNDGPADLPSATLPFIENMPLRNQPPLVNDVPGASAIQQEIERIEWAMESSSPVAYAPHLRKDPLSGVAARPVLFVFAKGDKTVPNPTETAIPRAGDLTDRTMYYRYDLDYLTHPQQDDNPHGVADRDALASFLSSDGADVVDPDGDGPIWETPITPDEFAIADDQLSFIGPPIFLTHLP